MKIDIQTIERELPKIVLNFLIENKIKWRWKKYVFVNVNSRNFNTLTFLRKEDAALFMIFFGEKS